MNKLTGRQAFTHQIAVYVPSTMDVDMVIDTTTWVTRMMEKLATLFGGATSQDAVGAWLSSAIGLVKEGVTIVYAFADMLADDAINAVVELAESMRDALRQEAVAISVDGKLYFI